MKLLKLIITLSLLSLPAFSDAQTTPQPEAPDPAAREAFLTYLRKAPGEGPVNEKWPGFQTVWENQRAGFAKSKTTSQGAVVFLGDSITQYFVIGKAFPKLKTANRGIAGDTTRGMLYRLQEDVIDLNPRLIVFLAGVNDLGKKSGTPQTVAANVRSILGEIQKKLPKTPVIVCEIMPAKNPGIVEANAAVDQVLTAFPKVRRLKINHLFLNADGTQNASLFKDGTHPNLAGYAIWQAALEPKINALMHL
ncbi:MAG: hypothetical protein RL376_867 [Verrucomicrobiota bacterium]|jgi:lysophospholipase L1-like esterase